MVRYTIFKKDGLGLDLGHVLNTYKECASGIAIKEDSEKYVVTITEPVVLDWVDSLMTAFEPVGIEWLVEELN